MNPVSCDWAKYYTRMIVSCCSPAANGEQEQCGEIKRRKCATMTSCVAVTHFRESDAEGLSFVVAPDVTLQAVLAAKSLLTAVTGTVEWLLPYRDSGEEYTMRRKHKRWSKLSGRKNEPGVKMETSTSSASVKQCPLTSLWLVSLSFYWFTASSWLSKGSNVSLLFWHE